MEFVAYDEALNLLREHGIREVRDGNDRVSLEFDDADEVVHLHLSCADSTCTPHSGASTVTIAKDGLPSAVEHILHKLHLALRHDESIEAMLRLEAAGYRDYLWLLLLPPLQVLHDDIRFQAIVDGMRADVERQRTLVLTADWLPPELREAEMEATTP